MRVLTSDLDSAGSIYPLRVPYEALKAVERVVVEFCQVPVLASDMDSAGSIYPLWVPYEVLEAVGRVVENFEYFDFEGG